MTGIHYLTLINKFWFSFWQSCVCVIISLLIGGGLAFLENKLKIKSSRIFNGLMALPIFLPGIIVATGFIIIYGNNGLLNHILIWLHLPAISILYHPSAIILAHVYYNIPLAYLALQARLYSFHPYLEEAGEVAGASAWRIFWQISWPRLKNTVIGVSLLIFLYCFLSFSLPLILGGIKYQTIEVYIYSLITQQFNWPAASAIAILQCIFLIAVIIIFFKYLKNIHEPHLLVSKSQKKIISISTIRAILTLFIITPLLAVIMRGFSYANFLKLLNLGFLPALIRSLIIVMACLIVSLGIIIFFLNKKKFGRQLIFLLTLSPVTLGLLFLLIFGKSYLAMLLAYLVLILPLSYYLIQAAWEARPNFFLETVDILGANHWQKIKTSLKYLMPTILKTSALGSALILGDITIANLLNPYLKPTAMSFCYSLMGNYRFTLATTGMAFILLLIFIIIMLLLFIAKHYDPTNKKSYR